MGRHPHHKGHKMPPVVVFIGEQRFKHVKRISKPARQIQVRTVTPVQGWTQAKNELPGHPTTEDVAGSHDPCAGTIRARAVPFMDNPAGFPLVDDDVTPLVFHWWTMTSTHKAWRGGNEIKADVGGGGLQTGRDKMAESSHKPVTFDLALQREKARQKRHHQGGKQPELSHRLDQQEEIPLVPPKRKKMPAKETLLKDSTVLHTLGPARPASPSKEVASMLSSLRPPPSPYRTPPDLPSTIEELLDQVPECAEGPPLEEVQEEKKDNPFGWHLPPTPSNWHDTPPKKGVPYAVLFGRDPIYVYDDNHQAVPSPDECPFHQLPLPHHISKQGWAYVKCPAQPCAVFLDEKAAPILLDQLRQQKHPQLMAGRGTADDPQPPLMCFCNEPLALRVSRTAKNPGRLFLGCKSQKCTFFQLTGEPWSQSLRDRWAQVLRHLGP